MVLVGAHAFLPPFREAARTAPAGSAPQVGRGRGGRVCRPRQWQRSRRRGRSSDPMTGPASAVVRRVPCPPRTRLGGSSPPQRRLADHVAHEPLGLSVGSSVQFQFLPFYFKDTGLRDPSPRLTPRSGSNKAKGPHWWHWLWACRCPGSPLSGQPTAARRPPERATSSLSALSLAVSRET